MARTRPLRPRPPLRELGGPLIHLDAVGSTNDHARRLAEAGAPGGTVVVAEEQTAGRGRQGRRWRAPRGRGLTLSVLARAGEGRGPAGAGLALLPLAAALAVCEACEAAAPVECRIKWPNDVWVAERKVAGILIEARPDEGWAVIGIGVNVDTAEQELEPELAETATSLRIATGAPVDRGAVLDAVLGRLAVRLDELRGEEAASVLSAFHDRDALLGKKIAWMSRGEEQLGEAQGIDARGSLVVLTSEGSRIALDAGEVHLTAAAGGGN